MSAARIPLTLLTATLVCAGRTSAQVQSSVGMMTRHYIDGSRRNWDNSAPRPIRTTIWYPAPPGLPQRIVLDSSIPFSVPPVAEDAPVASTPRTFPLILLSHGTGGSAIQLMWLGHRLASHGYIVAAVSHHGNTSLEARPAAQGFLLYWERARDLDVALKALVADTVLSARIDTTRIGAAGFSLGGYTVLAAAGARFNQVEYDRFCASPDRDFTCEGQAEFPQAPSIFAELRKSDTVVQASLRHAHDSYRIPAVKAVLAIAPALGSGFTRADVADVRIPVLIVAGDSDRVAPIATNARRFAALIPGATLTVMPRVGHYTFLAECTERGRALLTLLCREAAGADRHETHERVTAMALDFFRQLK